MMNILELIFIKKAVKYLKDNNIGEKLIKDYRLNIYDHLNSKDKDDLLKFKKRSIFMKENLKMKLIKNMDPKTYELIIDNENKPELGIGSGEPVELRDEEEPFDLRLRCVIQMTEYTPISGGNIRIK